MDAYRTSGVSNVFDVLRETVEYPMDSTENLKARIRAQAWLNTHPEERDQLARAEIAEAEVERLRELLARLVELSTGLSAG